MTADFNSILSILDDVNKTLEKNIFIPSTKTNIVAKPLTTQHTKKLIRTSIEGPFADTLFNIEMYHILKDVLGLPDLSGMNVLDKIAILIQLRINNVSNIYTLTYNKQEFQINLNDKLNELNLLKISKPTKITSEKISGIIDFASIEEEFRFDSYLYNNHMQIDSNDTDKLKQLVLPLFINNVGIYLQSLIINENVIELRERPVTERIKIIEKLPSEFLTELVSQIDKNIGKHLTDALDIKIKADDAEYIHRLNIDAGFFLQ